MGHENTHLYKIMHNYRRISIIFCLLLPTVTYSMNNEETATKGLYEIQITPLQDETINNKLEEEQTVAAGAIGTVSSRPSIRVKMHDYLINLAQRSRFERINDKIIISYATISSLCIIAAIIGVFLW